MSQSANQEYKKYRSEGGKSSFRDFMQEYNLYLKDKTEPKETEEKKSDSYYASGEQADTAPKKEVIIFGMKPFQLGLLVVITGVTVYYFWNKNKTTPSIA